MRVLRQLEEVKGVDERKGLEEMNDTDGQEDRIDDESQDHPKPFQVHTMERHPR